MNHDAPSQHPSPLPVRRLLFLIVSLSPLSVSSCIRNSAQPQVSADDLHCYRVRSNASAFAHSRLLARFRELENIVRTVSLILVPKTRDLLPLYDILPQYTRYLPRFQDLSLHFGTIWR